MRAVTYTLAIVIVTCDGDNEGYTRDCGRRRASDARSPASRTGKPRRARCEGDETNRIGVPRDYRARTPHGRSAFGYELFIRRAAPCVPPASVHAASETACFGKPLRNPEAPSFDLAREPGAKSDDLRGDLRAIIRGPRFTRTRIRLEV